MNEKNTFLLGVIVKAQGIKGEVKVKPYTDTPDVLCHLKHIIIKDKKVDIQSARADNTMAYIKLAGIEDRDMAEGLRGVEIYVEKENAPKLPSGRYYIDDLLGCMVFDDENEELGSLINVMQNGANDVYVIKNKNGEILVPVLNSVIKEIDIEKKEIVLIKHRLAEVALYEY
ncbi:MAG: ribosome maturation factor RimM [Eubacteriales bacterium]